MYAYIYDEFCQTPHHHRTMAMIEERLMDLGINGKICRLTHLKSLHDVIEQETRRGVKTIVAVGDDTTVERVFNVLASLSKQLILGIIPISGRNDIAKNLKIPEGVAACNILSYRMIRTLRLGKINNRYFLSTISIEGEKIQLECDQNFVVKSAGSGGLKVKITNFAEEVSCPDKLSRLKIEVLPMGKLNWLPINTSPSIFLNSNITIAAKDRFALSIDERRVVATPPVIIETTNKKLDIITGYLRPSLLANPRTPKEKIN